MAKNPVVKKLSLTQLKALRGGKKCRSTRKHSHCKSSKSHKSSKKCKKSSKSHRRSTRRTSRRCW